MPIVNSGDDKKTLKLLSSIARELETSGASSTMSSILEPKQVLELLEWPTRSFQRLEMLSKAFGSKLQLRVSDCNDETIYSCTLEISNPALVSHGSGPDVESARDAAASKILTSFL